MIWFFLGGMLAGAVGMILLAGWWAKKHGLNNNGGKKE